MTWTPEQTKEYQRRYRLMNKEAILRSKRLGISVQAARNQIADEDEKQGMQYTDLVRYTPSDKNST